MYLTKRACTPHWKWVLDSFHTFLFNSGLFLIRNVASFAESYKKRKDILTELNKKIRWAFTNLSTVLSQISFRFSWLVSLFELAKKILKLRGKIKRKFSLKRILWWNWRKFSGKTCTHASFRCEVLLVTGMKSRYVADTEVIHKEMEPGSCSMIKVFHTIIGLGS